MIFKNFPYTISLAIALCFCLLLFPNNAFSLSLNTSTSHGDVLEAMEGFLSSLPKDYYTIQKIDKLKNIKNSLLVDVREPLEYIAGHIPKAINIPLRTLTQNLAQIPHDQPVILYCSTGYRTAMGVMTLQLLGYSNVGGFPPSIQGWKNAGEPLEILPEKVAKFN